MHWLKQTEIDYGVPMTPVGVKILDLQINPIAQKIWSANHYIRTCRRLAERRGVELACDYRIIGAGWNVVKPSDWVPKTFDGWTQLDDLIDYWNVCSRRPNIVGSCFNEATPDVAFWAMRAHIPPHVTMMLGSRVLSRGGLDSRPYCSRKRLEMLRHAARAVRRTLPEYRWILDKFTTKALAMLGRAAPNMQRLILRQLEADSSRRLHAREINWQAAIDTTRILTDRRPLEVLDDLIINLSKPTCTSYWTCVQ
jgi:hypothetical protein